MATSINVELCDLTKAVKNLNEIKAALQGLFDEVVKKKNLDLVVAVSVTTTYPTVKGKDLLCYFVKSVGDSIVTARSFAGSQTINPKLWGNTIYRSDKTVASEVYANRLAPPVPPAHAASLVLHELMHNMSLTGAKMHKRGMSIGAATVMEGASLSKVDMTWIATHLGKTERSQWSKGFTTYNEPLRGND